MNIGAWVTFALKIGPLVVGAVQAVERIVKGAKGKEKQDAAVEFLMTALAGVEAGLGRDVLEDALVQKALRDAIDAIVAVENVIAAKRAAAG